MTGIRGITPIAVVMLLLLLVEPPYATKFGFTSFPYDLTAESQRRIQNLVMGRKKLASSG